MLHLAVNVKRQLMSHCISYVIISVGVCIVYDVLLHFSNYYI